ncbi:MAG: hypothetical protein MJ078_07745, partial [Clostridia bacterium]|nr:hypothetical protein [Clostridia bacterium]
IILYVAILLIIAFVIGFFAFFTNGFSEDYKSFYVIVDNERILSSKSGLTFEKGTPVEVQVRYALAEIGDKKSGYSIEIVPNEQYDFDFTVDGEVMSFGSIRDFKNGFTVTEQENSFTIAPKGSLQDILEALYPGKTIEYSASSLESGKDMFTLIVTSYNGKDDVLIHFRVLRYAMEIVFDPEVIEF